MKIIQNLSLILAAVALTACANNPEQMPSQQPNTMTSCITDEATKLVGQTGLSEAVIKAKTKAEIVRMVAPGQPVTLDYRSNRVTVVTDPQTKIIVQVSCG
ncbi:MULTISPECIES: I78 family peptidase inhibitor [Acinetobacter]|uniref:Hemolysin n=3 Tax=Acinetobacter TaxID=469 RepID=A0AB35M3A7_9GAMM|nr:MULTISPECIES: I78 family peptidase inhibitor [Acinetobacter]MCO8109667.1 I78 family peptidase inhibitor [Acinetobacter indicus]MDM1720112.1 hemolysin [Acinetobacter towneri]MDM1722755.1 hemolysin [Acinetobacter towneri]MDM1732214.1 hemolysin [Acinetobacter towneri]MDM1734936.1 hemolysin [Acinetobacter towneri]